MNQNNFIVTCTTNNVHTRTSVYGVTDDVTINRGYFFALSFLKKDKSLDAIS